MKSPDFFLKIPVELYRAVVVRVVLLLVFSGSLALIGWSFGRLAPAEKKLQTQTDKIAHLEDEVLKLELKWNPREAEQVAARFKQAQEQVFAGNEEFLRWQDQLSLAGVAFDSGDPLLALAILNNLESKNPDDTAVRESIQRIRRSALQSILKNLQHSAAEFSAGKIAYEQIEPEMSRTIAALPDLPEKNEAATA